jgi:hypothetical protein
MPNTETKRLRLSLVISRPMRIALEVLAQKEEAYLATTATRVLRQALDRTINSAAVQERLRQHNAQRNHATWLNDTMTDHAVEGDYATFNQTAAQEAPAAADATAEDQG